MFHTQSDETCCVSWSPTLLIMHDRGRGSYVLFVHSLTLCELGSLAIMHWDARLVVVDTPFLTVLKTWTSPFEHSVIIHVCLRLEFPVVSATRPASGSPNSTVLCLVLHQTLVFCLGKAEDALWDIPLHHRQWLEATGWFCVATGNVYCRSALFVAGRHSFLAKWHFCPADYCSVAFWDILRQLSCIFFPSIHVYGGMSFLVA